MKSQFGYRFFKQALVVLLTGFIFTSCKNDLEVYTDYEAQAIVYGVLNPYDSVQTFKITKTFAGTEDPLLYANVPDSNYFKDVSVKLIESEFGEDRRSWDLIETVVKNKETGDFFGPEQTVYTVTLSKGVVDEFYLNPQAEFRIEGTVDGQDIGGKFEIIKEQTGVNAFFLNAANKFSRFWRGAVSFVNGASINELTFELTYPEGTKVAGLQMIFHYDEVYANSEKVVEKEMIFELGEQIVSNAADQRQIEFKFDGERFFERIGSELTDAADESNLLYRKSAEVEFRMFAVTEDLFYYRQVKNASSGIAQDRPEYTNIENGFGVLAGRQLVTMNQQLKAHGSNEIEVLLNKATEKELVTGLILGYTGSKGFCADKSHNLGSISCP